MTVIALDSWSESDQKAIREQMDRILKSGPFRQSRRRQRFSNTSSMKRWLGVVAG